MNITIIGCGYVGLNTGVLLAYLKHNVICVDKDLKKIESLKKGISPIYEHGLETLLSKTKEKIRFTTELKQSIVNSNIIIIAVGTPAKKNGEVDIRYVEEVINEIVNALKEGQCYTIVIKSTVPVGTNRRISAWLNQILTSRGTIVNLDLVSNPEFLREGRALSDTFYPDRIVIGSDNLTAIDNLRKIYLPILEQSFVPPRQLPRAIPYRLPVLLETTSTNAEMIKYASNAFLALKISYINEIGGLCEKVGADIKEVTYGMGLDPRIGPLFLNAGIGWGGSCFPKDTAALLALGAEYEYSMPIVEASCAINYRQREVIIKKLQSELGNLQGRIVGILGLAFKPGTDDVRDSPAIDIIKLLNELGVKVKAHDPIAIPNAQKILGEFNIEYGITPFIVACECDALVLTTEWEEYLKLDFFTLQKVMRFPLLIDGRNFLKRNELIKAGFVYKGIGIDNACVGDRGSGIHWESSSGQVS